MANTNSQYAEDKLRNRTVRFSESLWTKVDQIAARKEYGGVMSNVIRDAVRRFIDEQEDIIGSRGHFQKTLRERIDTLEQHQTEELSALTEAINQQLGNGRN